MPGKIVQINRAPVLTLWAAVVAEAMGFARDEALTLGKAVAGLNAQAKGRRLGIFKPPQVKGDEPAKRHGLGEEFWVEICGRPVPVKNTQGGLRAVVKDQPVDPAQVETYLRQKFGADLNEVLMAMKHLASTFDSKELSERAYGLYEQFRPQIESGRSGWGQKGALDLDLIRSLRTD